MAKTKRKNVSIEDVLVPMGEQPHDIPNNWTWVYLSGILAEIKNGTTIKQDKSGDGYSVTRIESLQNQTIDFNRLGTIVNSESIKKEDWYIAGDIALSHINSAEHVGKTAIITDDMLPLVHGMNLLRLRFHNICDPKFFQYFTQSYQYKDEILKRINMAVNQVSINQKQIGTLEFPLPPLAEQKRIVEQIENLFAKLDEAKEKAQDVVDNYDVRYASILRSLFDGELSKEWREENSVCKDSWASCPFDTCIEKMQNGLAKRSGTEGKLFGVLRLANLGEDDFDTEDLREIRLTEKEQEKYKLNVGDIIMIRVNGSRDNVGRQLLVDEEQNWAFCDHIMRMKLTEDILPQYMVLFSKTDEYRYYIEEHMVSSAGQNTISRKGMSELAIPVPSIEEQEYMVKVINRLISKEKLVKEKVESVIEQIELMKKSILAKAFRGELGTNIPEEESSIELLKKMIEEG